MKASQLKMPKNAVIENYFSNVVFFIFYIGTTLPGKSKWWPLNPRGRTQYKVIFIIILYFDSFRSAEQIERKVV